MLKSNDPCWCGSGKKYKRCHKASEERVRPGTLSPPRPVPSHIPKPDYATTGEPKRRDEPRVKSSDVIERMRVAGRVAAEILQKAGERVAPGVTTDAIDEFVHEATIERGAYPSPLNYRGFPKSLCTSVNEVICHGIPDSRPLEGGDIVNLDVTVYLEGMHGDCSATFLVGEVDPEGRRLVEAARECLAKGIAAVRPGRPISDIGKAIESHASRHGYGVVRAYCGHGIGESFHTALQIAHHYDPALKRLMEPGMTFTIEPMITEGTWEDALWDDGWTAVTADGKRSAQFEHTIAVGANGAEILTVE
jgi:methionyl aminopeptidase